LARPKHRQIDVYAASPRLPTAGNAEVNAISVILENFRDSGALSDLHTKNMETGRFEPSALLGFPTSRELFFVDGAGCCLRAAADPGSAVSRDTPAARRDLKANRPLSRWPIDMSRTVQSPEGERLFWKTPTDKFLQDIHIDAIGAGCGSQGYLPFTAG